MCFLFATMPKSGRVHVQTIDKCRKRSGKYVMQHLRISVNTNQLETGKQDVSSEELNLIIS